MPAEAVLAALNALLKAIAPLKLPAALLGGLALAIWKHPRFTRDVDVLVALGDVDDRDLMAALRKAGFQPKRGDGLIRLADLTLLQLIYHAADSLVDVQVDLLLATDRYQQEALARKQPARIAGFDEPVDVLTCEDMIIHKLIAGRLIDLADVAALLRANHKALDYSYLLRWMRVKDLSGAFLQTWNEALPGRPAPE